VTNYVQKAWVHLYPKVESTRDKLETYLFENADLVESHAEKLSDKEGDEAARLVLTQWQEDYASLVLRNWTELFTDLVTRFHDGAMVESLHDSEISYTAKPWPLWWLEQAGFFKVAAEDSAPLIIPAHTDDPPMPFSSLYPHSFSTLSGNPKQLADIGGQPTNVIALPVLSTSFSIHTDLIGFVAFTTLLLTVGILIGNRYTSNKRRREYAEIE